MSHSKHIYIDDIELIKSTLSSVSLSIIDHIENAERSVFTLWYKNMTHSDLTNRGKRNGNKEGLEKNLLYYLTVEEMRAVEESSGKPFESAKQSNIGLPTEFYEELKIPRIQRRVGAQKTQHTHVILNDYMDVKLVNDSLLYFQPKYTELVMQKLNKVCPWSETSNYTLEDGDFTRIQLSQAIHGLGTSNDDVFSKLRLQIFLNDIIYFLFERNTKDGSRTLYILLEKNPLFYTLAGVANESWTRYLQVSKMQKDNKALSSVVLDTEDEKTRKRQAAWKKLLAREMMNYTTHEGEVFCPFTSITANFEDLQPLFIASHIKRFADSEVDEAYDINNGLLLCANADALFDKHLISVSEKKELMYSFLIENDKRLLRDLKINQDIFQEILNDKRMEFMKDHRRIFLEKEKQRKNPNLISYGLDCIEQEDSTSRMVADPSTIKFIFD